MEFPISSIKRICNRSPRGFTLVELLIGTTLSGFTMVGVLSTFLLMGRMGASIRNYTEIEAKARASIEQFAREVRMAYAVTSNSTTSVSLSIPDTTSVRKGTAGTGDYSVTYTFDTVNKLLTRTGPPINDPTGSSTTSTLITGVQQISGIPLLTYYRYVNNPTSNPANGYTDGIGTNIAGNVLEIRQIEVSFQVQRTDVTVATANNKVLSARFILRNK
jgi:Tfp pilus assembly protein PilW